jgi:hypothetical protein
MCEEKSKEKVIQNSGRRRSETISPAVGQLVLDSIAAGGRGELLIGLYHFTSTQPAIHFSPRV